MKIHTVLFDAAFEKQTLFFIYNDKVYYSYDHYSMSESMITIYNLEELVIKAIAPKPYLVSMNSGNLVRLPKDRNTILYQIQRRLANASISNR